jgi:hypothetical protein
VNDRVGLWQIAEKLRIDTKEIIGISLYSEKSLQEQIIVRLSLFCPTPLETQKPKNRKNRAESLWIAPQ